MHGTSPNESCQWYLGTDLARNVLEQISSDRQKLPGNWKNLVWLKLFRSGNCSRPLCEPFGNGNRWPETVSEPVISKKCKTNQRFLPVGENSHGRQMPQRRLSDDLPIAVTQMFLLKSEIRAENWSVVVSWPLEKHRWTNKFLQN